MLSAVHVPFAVAFILMCRGYLGWQHWMLNATKLHVKPQASRVVRNGFQDLPTTRVVSLISTQLFHSCVAFRSVALGWQMLRSHIPNHKLRVKSDWVSDRTGGNQAEFRAKRLLI